jgi:N-acetylmuramoyl-L-alanine amidase
LKRLLLLLIVFQSAAFAEDSGLIAVPDVSQVMDYAYEEVEETSEVGIQTTEPGELINIEKVPYVRNKKASFCTRPVEMVDTIVIHHSETPSTSTPQDINNYHLNRGTPSDPWYMIAYSFVINSPYEGATLPLSRVTEGRPFEIVGAHAGSNIFIPMDATQSKLWAQKKILCGKENQKPKYDSTLVKNKKIKANVTTIGIVVNGNYSPYLLPGNVINPNGYMQGEARGPSASTIDMAARLSCQLQKKYPRITTLAYHNQYHSTSCPGDIAAHMEQLKSKAKEYGCEFSVLQKSYY